MCIHNTTSRDCDYCLPSGSVHSAPISHSDAGREGKINWNCTYPPSPTSFTSPDATSSSAHASLPDFSSIDQSLESVEHSIYTLQPPPHVIDFWFDRLGLSLDPTSWGNPAGSLSRLPPFDGNDCVSSFMIILCRMTPFSSPDDLG